jgi:hypothetical protein
MPKSGKTVSSKPAGKFKVSGGPSGGMHKFAPVGNQKSGTSATAASGGGSKSWEKANTGGSGKMQKFTPVKGVKPA